jgi:hypothetical protein
MPDFAKTITQLARRSPGQSDLMLVGDPVTGALYAAEASEFGAGGGGGSGLPSQPPGSQGWVLTIGADGKLIWQQAPASIPDITVGPNEPPNPDPADYWRKITQLFQALRDQQQYRPTPANHIPVRRKVKGRWRIFHMEMTNG